MASKGFKIFPVFIYVFDTDLFFQIVDSNNF